MTREELEQLEIGTLHQAAMEEAKKHWDGIAKPLDGLGRFEEFICRIAGITGDPDVVLDKRGVIAMCADNGIVAEGVTQSPQEVTAIVSANMAKGIASVCRMGSVAGVEVIPVNIGIHDEVSQPGLLDRNVRKGTRDFLLEPAMTQEEMYAAVEVGIRLVEDLKKKGYRVLATGEMGIGNTTTSSAIASVLCRLPVQQVTGRGAGLSKEGVARKVDVIQRAISRYGLSDADPLKVLQCVGGLDIAGLTGVYIGGALYRVPIVIDGVIAAVAALVAERVLPGCRQYMLPSHMSGEPAAAAIMKELQLHPVIDGNLSLGEGTGAVMLFPLLDMVLEVYRENTTFGAIRIQQYERYER